MNRKHQQFINEYLKCWNATEAYRIVYPKSAYDSARANAARLIANDSILAEIRQRIDENSMSADEVLSRLAEQGRGDLGDYLDDKGNIVLTGAKTRLLKKVTTRRVVRSKGKEETEEDTTVSLELYDAQAALVQIGKHHKLFVDRIEHTGANGEPLAIILDL